MPGGAIFAHVERDRDDGVLDRAADKSGRGREASKGRRVLETVAVRGADAQHTYRGGSGRPALQLQRETARASAPDVGQFRERGQARASNTEDQSGSAGGDDRYDPLKSQFLH